MKRILLSAVLLTTLVACGDDDKKDGNVTRSCNYDADDFCMTVTASAAVLDAAGATAASCAADGGAAGPSCPSASRLGRCAYTDVGLQIVEHFYSPTYDEANIAGACAEVGGTFTPNFGAGQDAPEGE